MKNTLIIDKSALLYRFCFGRNVLNKEHKQIGGVLAFLKYLFTLSQKYKFDNIIIASEGINNKRRTMDVDYKSNRPKMPDFIKEQFAMTNKLIKIMNILNLSIEGYEADDVIYNVCKNFSSENNKFTILTSDKDLCHSLNDHSSLWIISSVRSSLIKIEGKKEFENFSGIHPDKYCFFLSLAGDRGDNIKGVKNVGKVTAAKLIKQFSSLDDLYNNIDKIKEEKVRNRLKEDKLSAYKSFELASAQKIDKKILKELVLEEIDTINGPAEWMNIEKLNSFSKENFSADIKKVLNSWF